MLLLFFFFTMNPKKKTVHKCEKVANESKISTCFKIMKTRQSTQLKPCSVFMHSFCTKESVIMFQEAENSCCIAQELLKRKGAYHSWLE